MKILIPDSSVTASTLRKALALAEDIENKQAQLNALLSGQTISTSERKTCRVVNSERSKAISEGLKRKWAERKAALEQVAQPAPKTDATTSAP
jgi:hypothetical protein